MANVVVTLHQSDNLAHVTSTVLTIIIVDLLSLLCILVAYYL